MRCTSRGPHQLQALSLQPVGSQGVSTSAYGNRSRENSGWLGDGACVCALADTKTSLKSYNLIGRRIISIISPSRISRIFRICRQRGIFDGRIVILLELPILLSISRRLQNHGSRLDRRCSARGLCKAEGALYSSLARTMHADCCSRAKIKVISLYHSKRVPELRICLEKKAI